MVVIGGFELRQGTWLWRWLGIVGHDVGLSLTKSYNPSSALDSNAAYNLQLYPALHEFCLNR